MVTHKGKIFTQCPGPAVLAAAAAHLGGAVRAADEDLVAAALVVAVVDHRGDAAAELALADGLVLGAVHHAVYRHHHPATSWC